MAPVRAAAPETPAPSALGAVKSFLPMMCLYALRGVDFTTNANALFWLRVFFGAVHAGAMLINLLLYTRITRERDMTELNVEFDGKKEKVHEHDCRQLLSGVKVTAISCAAVLAMHLKFCLLYTSPSPRD